MDKYIKNKALLNALKEERKNGNFVFTSKWIKEIIDNLPAADVVEVKHGKWLKTDAYPHRVYCSLCYKTYVTNEEVIRGRSDGHSTYCSEAEYCPHCGAKMDLKKGAEE